MQEFRCGWYTVSQVERESGWTPKVSNEAMKRSIEAMNAWLANWFEHGWEVSTCTSTPLVTGHQPIVTSGILYHYIFKRQKA